MALPLVHEVQHEHVAFFEPPAVAIGPGRPSSRHHGRRALQPLAIERRDGRHRTIHPGAALNRPVEFQRDNVDAAPASGGAGGRTMSVGATIRAALPRHIVTWSGNADGTLPSRDVAKDRSTTSGHRSLTSGVPGSDGD